MSRGPRKVKPKDEADWGRDDDPLEKAIEKSVKSYARSLGVIVRKWVSPSQRGVLDDLFFFPHGCLLIVEFKRKGRKPTKKQQQEIDTLTKQGFEVRVVDSTVNGKALIKNWYEYAKNTKG